MEEVNQTLELVLRELRAQYETLQSKAVEEELDAICLDDVIRVDHCLAF